MLRKFVRKILRFALQSDPLFRANLKKSITQRDCRPQRSDIINKVLEYTDKENIYLEIGVRNPADNFHLIEAQIKYSVDPGLEFQCEDVDFKMTSDQFFEELENGQLLSISLKFDVIFIDGFHSAEQLDRDIKNSLNHIKDNGFIIIHDCNPPTEYHARESFDFKLSPALQYWSGTSWKAFFKARQRDDISSCCVDSDWGVGIISKNRFLGLPTSVENSFFDYSTFDRNRKESLNLIGFEKLIEILEESKKRNEFNHTA